MVPRLAEGAVAGCPAAAGRVTPVAAGAGAGAGAGCAGAGARRVGRLPVLERPGRDRPEPGRPGACGAGSAGGLDRAGLGGLGRLLVHRLGKAGRLVAALGAGGLEHVLLADPAANAGAGH